MSTETKTRLIKLDRYSIARIDTASPQRAQLTIMTPATAEEGTGYCPAESVSVSLYRASLLELIDALAAVAADLRA